MSALYLNNDSFQQEVLQSDKPVLLDFFATWCGPCGQLSPIIDQLAAEHPELKVAKINVDEETELAQQFRVMSIPALFVLKNGKVVNQSVGAKSMEQILDMIP